MPEMDAAKLKEIYATMVRIRFFEERAITEYRKGLPGFIHPSIGQEAIPAGVCAFLREDDYIITTHRGHGDIIAKGARLDRMMAELFAKETGYCRGKGGSMHIADVERNILGATGIVGDGIPIAAGVGLGCKMQNLDRVVVAFFGDGATNSGAFHEGVGLAAIWSLPVLFVCENNQFQQSTPMRDYTRLTDLADRAKAYGIPGITVDGNDAIAVAEVARESIEKCRKGEGPILVVGNTYRTVGHHMGDPGTSYRSKEEVEEWKKKDPIDRLRRQLLENKIATEAEIEEIHNATLRELDEAVKFAQESPEPKVEEALEDIYA
ncbi:MAG TPA: thiamine pyrophosphate-dependent dehydrogenase E1 component subunit alpha [Dehalococcoidia bacterium]|jgi:pyruvate dehydrogenase E1 component alpha subunit|nr:thiamine pyrophosphate-dependent dehydrogenase E1 component subunit alpha [Dehalococcoidia bacterium]